MVDQTQKNIPAYDLHLHTHWSYDATAEVEAYFRAADSLGVRCIAITEHHHMDSASELARIAPFYPRVRAIPAAELSVSTSIGPVDLLCYNLPWEPSGELADLFERYRQWQQQAGAAISAGMQAIGFDYDEAARLSLLRRYRPEQAITEQGATHVRMQTQRDYFIERGYIADPSEYPDLLRRARQEVTGPAYPRVEQVRRVVHDAGGLIAIAHPQGYFNGADSARMDALRRECELDGIECAHPKVDPACTPIYQSYCRRHGLFATGGSDCHSSMDIEERFGRHGGDVAWLDAFLKRVGAAESMD